MFLTLHASLHFRRQRRAVKRLLSRSCSTSSTSSHAKENNPHAHSSSRGSTTPDPQEGVNPFRANAVDFHLTPQDALSEFKKWNGHVFAPTPFDALLDREKSDDGGEDNEEVDASTNSSGRKRGFFTRLVQKHSSLTVHAVFVPFWVFDAVVRCGDAHGSCLEPIHKLRSTFTPSLSSRSIFLHLSSAVIFQNSKCA